MTELIRMTNPAFPGAANVLPEHVEAWKAKGWKEATPARGKASKQKRAQLDAKMKGQNNESI